MSVRLYAIVRIEWPNDKRCWLIEFGLSDNPSIVTLLFAPVPSAEAAPPEEAIALLVSQAVAPRGWWTHAAVDSIASGYSLRVERIHRDWITLGYRERARAWDVPTLLCHYR
jgi:hypothetical protein